MSAWVPLITNALAFAIQQAKSLGLKPPMPDEIDRIRKAIDDKLNEVLPLAIVGVAAAAVGVAAKAEHAIESLGKSPTCPKCGGFLTQHVTVQIDGPAERSYTCSSCGWAS